MVYLRRAALVTVFKNLKEKLDHQKQASSVHSLEDTSSSKGYYQQLINTIKMEAEQNFATITLEKIASIVHMNPNYVSKLFYQKTGQLFSEYILSVKMSKALEYFSDIHCRTYEVSELVGYRNTKNFSRAFKAFYGMTPKEYRERGTLDDKL